MGWELLGWPSTQGRACTPEREAELCIVGARTCTGDLQGRDGYCTSRCAEGQRCPTGYSVCREGLCRADREQGPQGCGLLAAGPGRSCAAGCPEGEVCVDTLLALPLPDSLQPFCTRTCSEDTDCPGQTRCSHTAATGRRICLSEACSCLARPEGEETLIDRALGAIGFDRCSAIFRIEHGSLIPDAIEFDPFRLSHFNRVHDQPFSAPAWARELSDQLGARAASATPLTDSIEEAATRLDFPVCGERPSLEPPAGDEPLVEALLEVYRVAGEEKRADREALSRAVAGLPPALARKVAVLLLGAARARLLRDQALGPWLEDEIMRYSAFEYLPGTLIVRGDFWDLPMSNPRVRQMLEGEGLAYCELFAAGRDLAWALEQQDWAAEAGSTGFELTVDTPLGQVLVRDGAEHEYSPTRLRRPLLLLVDTGGRDRYLIPAGANTSEDHAVSLVLDLEGDDFYGYPEAWSEEGPLPADPADPNRVPADAAGRYPGDHPQVGTAYGPFSLSATARQGGARLGVAMLYDLAGDDLYVSPRMSQGFAALGVGALVDRGGNDTYRCESGCQGSALYGIGLALDLGEGDDSYLLFDYGQGLGYVRGFGELLDAGGNDRYTAVPATPPGGGGTWLFPNSQHPNGGSNSSMAQGMGFGRRADTSDGVFASGGIGVLRDQGEGRDVYTCDVFGQGSAYWYGTGLFHDGGGDDTINGRYYVQGSTAHYALSFLLEDGGNDRYNQVEPGTEGRWIVGTMTGQGHDRSLSFLIDRSGDDIYSAPSLGLGGANDNGAGFFLDLAGNDRYDAPGPDAATYGGCNVTGDLGPGWDDLFCLGVFLDAGGEDEYVTFAGEGPEFPIGNDRLWTFDQRRPGRRPGEDGVGLDAAGGDPGIR